MKSVSIRLALILSVISATEMLWSGTVLAHTGEGAGTEHIVIEFGLWGLGVVGVLATIVVAFWIRAKMGRR